MKDRLAVLGGQQLVDTSLKVGWPIVTESDKRAVMRVLTEGPLWALSTDDGLVAPETSLYGPITLVADWRNQPEGQVSVSVPPLRVA